MNKGVPGRLAGRLESLGVVLQSINRHVGTTTTKSTWVNMLKLSAQIQNTRSWAEQIEVELHLHNMTRKGAGRSELARTVTDILNL